MPAVRAGRYVREYKTDFLDGVTLPPWLALRSDGNWAGSSIAPATRPTRPRGIDLVAASGASKNVGLSLVDPAAPTSPLYADTGDGKLAGLELEIAVSGGGWTGNGVVLGFNTPNYARGAMLVRDTGPAGTAGALRAYPSATVANHVTKTLATFRWEGNLMHSVGLRLLKRTENGTAVRYVQHLEDGVVLAERKFALAQIPSGLMRPEFSVIGDAAGAGGTIHTLHHWSYREIYV